MRHMTFRPLLTAAALVALIAAPAIAFAQSEISAAEEQRLEALARENAELYRPKSNVTVGFRLLSSGAKVHFGNLGSVPHLATVPAASAGNVDRIYDNGYVRADAARAAESAASTITLPNGRYQTTRTDNVTDAAGNVTGTTTVVTGDLLSYAPGLSRNWSYGFPGQITSNGYIAMSTYSATSDGGSMNKKQGPSGGVELQFSHVLGRVSKRTEWGFTSGISLNDINDKVIGSVLATLHTSTDFYSLNGLPAPTTSPAAPYVGPSFTDLTGSTGTFAGGLETTTPISQTSTLSTTSAIVGGTAVRGNWKLKGSYFLVKVGPTLRTQLTDRLGINASLGLAGAYAGTRYSAVEAFDIPDVGRPLTRSDESSASKFLSGYYADFNVEWSANETTGLFGGLTAQKFGDYDQSAGGRTARVDIGSAVGVRGGVSIKF